MESHGLLHPCQHGKGEGFQDSLKSYVLLGAPVNGRERLQGIVLSAVWKRSLIVIVDLHIPYILYTQDPCKLSARGGCTARHSGTGSVSGHGWLQVPKYLSAVHPGVSSMLVADFA